VHASRFPQTFSIKNVKKYKNVLEHMFFMQTAPQTTPQTIAVIHLQNSVVEC